MAPSPVVDDILVPVKPREPVLTVHISLRALVFHTPQEVPSGVYFFHPRAFPAHKTQTRPKGHKQYGSFTIAMTTGPQASAPIALLVTFPVTDRKILT